MYSYRLEEMSGGLGETSVYILEDYENLGEDCMGYCGQEGICNWCGKGGMCCRLGYEGNGCDGKMGQKVNVHTCIRGRQRGKLA